MGWGAILAFLNNPWKRFNQYFNFIPLPVFKMLAFADK